MLQSLLKHSHILSAPVYTLAATESDWEMTGGTICGSLNNSKFSAFFLDNLIDNPQPDIFYMSVCLYRNGSDLDVFQHSLPALLELIPVSVLNIIQPDPLVISFCSSAITNVVSGFILVASHFLV